MPTANEAIQDAFVRHQVGLERYTAGEVRKILALLRSTERDLARQVGSRLLFVAEGGVRSPAVTARLEDLLNSVRTMRAAAYRTAAQQLESRLIDLGAYEADFAARTMQTAAGPVELNLSTLRTIEQVGEIVRSQPFNGLILRDWTADLAAKELAGIKRAVNIGLVEGEGIDKIVRRVVGSKRAGVRGVLDISRHHAETWVRSAVSHTAQETRDRFYGENADLIQSVRWLATLDGRTTQLCMWRDGYLYAIDDHRPLDGGPPWLSGPGRIHARCRSTSTPVLKGRGVSGQRSSLDGTVPAKTTYREWIQRQPAALQNEVLGVGRAKAMRSGEVSWDALFTPRGELRTLKALRLSDGA